MKRGLVIRHKASDASFLKSPQDALAFIAAAPFETSAPRALFGGRVAVEIFREAGTLARSADIVALAEKDGSPGAMIEMRVRDGDGAVLARVRGFDRDLDPFLRALERIAGRDMDDAQRLGRVEKAMGADAGLRAIGSRGDDEILGGAGDDVLRGRGGDDAFLASGGADALDGGAGRDFVSWALWGLQAGIGPGEAGVVVDLGRGRARAPDGATATLTGFESAAGSQGDDRILGGGGADMLSGLAGDDTLRGRGGADDLGGDEGDDLILGQGGNDLLRGGAGDDTMRGGAGDDSFLGDGFLPFDAGADRMFGQGGNDFLDGGGSDDLLDGGVGADTLTGGGGVDTLRGGTGDDSLDGGMDADLLRGGAGADVLTGGFGADAFVLETGAGADLATDFDPAEDVFLLAGGLAFADLDIAQVGADARIAAGGETLMVLSGVDADALVEDLFGVLA